MTGGLIVYALAWAAFGAAHSLLARAPAKALLRRFAGRGMRLAWNIIAAIQLALVLAVGRAAVPPMRFDRPSWLVAAQGLALAAGALVLAAAGRGYDMRRFLGIAQLRGASEDDDEPLRTGGLLAWVRHPLYLGTLLALAGIAQDARTLATAVFATLYILIGLRFEERDLLRRYGAAYAEYRAAVPGLLPWRGRAWPPRAAV